MSKIKDTEVKIKDPKSDEIILYGYLHGELLEGKVQIHLETPYEVYDGPVEYLSFWNERK